MEERQQQHSTQPADVAWTRQREWTGDRAAATSKACWAGVGSGNEGEKVTRWKVAGDTSFVTRQLANEERKRQRAG